MLLPNHTGRQKEQQAELKGYKKEISLNIQFSTVYKSPARFHVSLITSWHPGSSKHFNWYCGKLSEIFHIGHMAVNCASCWECMSQVVSFIPRTTTFPYGRNKSGLIFRAVYGDRVGVKVGHKLERDNKISSYFHVNVNTALKFDNSLLGMSFYFNRMVGNIQNHPT